MREYIDIIRKASRGEMLDHDGEFFHTKRFRLRIPPYRPDLPIYIASLSPASLRLTGEVADGWLPIFLAPSRMTAAVAELEAGAKAAGRSLARHRRSRRRCRSTSPTDVAAARDRERPHIAFYIGGMGVFYHEYMHRIGFGADADRVREAFQGRDRDARGAARHRRDGGRDDDHRRARSVPGADAGVLRRRASRRSASSSTSRARRHTSRR